MSRHIKFNHMSRRLKRASEVAQDPDVSKSVKRVHDDVLAPKATAFCVAHESVRSAQAAVARTRRKVGQELSGYDSRYRLGRSVLLSYDPDAKPAETLKCQTTDTDKLEALNSLVSAVQSHAGEPWADELLADEFGTRAPEVKAALEGAIAATKALWVAQRARANALGPAYDAYLAFKQVVCDDMGSSSVHYRRLHVRAAQSPANQDEQAEEGEQTEEGGQAEEAAPDSAVVPSAGGSSTAATGEGKPVKVA